jgi:hypothetical protein
MLLDSCSHTQMQTLVYICQVSHTENEITRAASIFLHVHSTAFWLCTQLVHSSDLRVINAQYEHMALLDLLKQHPEWDKKVCEIECIAI